MARTMQRGINQRKQAPHDGQVTGPLSDPEDDIENADNRGEIKPLRPDKRWVRQNTMKEPIE